MKESAHTQLRTFTERVKTKIQAQTIILLDTLHTPTARAEIVQQAIFHAPNEKDTIVANHLIIPDQIRRSGRVLQTDLKLRRKPRSFLPQREYIAHIGSLSTDMPGLVDIHQVTVAKQDITYKKPNENTKKEITAWTVQEAKYSHFVLQTKK